MNSFNKNKKRVLLLNPAKDDRFDVSRIHMGLTLLGEILVSKGHEVLVIDYAFLRGIKNKEIAPEIEEVIKDFKPDVVGISVFTYLFDECQEFIEKISKFTHIPIILGGPHFSIFPEDFSKDIRVSYIVIGEGEKVIADLAERAKKEQSPVIIQASLPFAFEIPAINLDIVFGAKHASVYQIQLSRGCPYNCSFCNIKFVAGKQMRIRNLDDCFSQIVEAKKKYPNINTITITDDCPMIDKERFKKFLIMFKKANINCKLVIDNVRANFIDEEIVKLYKEAGGNHICLGVESGDKDVFLKINKGETLDEIKEAAELVRKRGLALGLCFIIGLPMDNPKRNRNSIKFAKSLKPDYIFWNMCAPWPKTEAYGWFKKYGKIGELRNFSTLIDPGLNFKEPICESSDFSKEERIRAWLVSNLETHNFFIKKISDFKKLFYLSKKYKIYDSLLIYFSGLPLKVSRIIVLKTKRKLQKTETT